MMLKELTEELNELINSIAKLYDEKVELEEKIKKAIAVINTHKFKDRYDRELLECLGVKDESNNDI